MDAKAIIEKIRTAEKKTPVKAYIRTTRPLHFENCHVFTGADMIVMGDYKDIAPVLERNEDAIEDLVVECDRRNSALPLADIKTLHARIEPGAIIRDLDLRRPIYEKTAAYGHFGREDADFTWEKTDRVEELKAACGL